MCCEIYQTMAKNEEYARGWVRLYETPENTVTAAQMAQYALALQKLKHLHHIHCAACKQESNEGSRDKQQVHAGV